MESRSFVVGVGRCHLERFKVNGNFLGGSKEGALDRLGCRRSVRSCVGLR